jgi:hypothetical protein
VKALFASPLSFAASILSSSDTGSKLRLPNSGDGTEDGGVDVDAAEDEDESLMSKIQVVKLRLKMISESAFSRVLTMIGPIVIVFRWRFT